MSDDENQNTYADSILIAEPTSATTNNNHLTSSLNSLKDETELLVINNSNNNNNDLESNNNSDNNNNNINNNEENMLEPEEESKLSNFLLLSHASTRFGDKMWEFVVPLILIFICPNSLIPVSLYGLVSCVVRIVCGASLGDISDKKKKILVVKAGVFGQAISIGSSLLLLFSSIHSLSGQIMDISVERKWVPAIVKRDSVLTKVNTRMRQIDLASEVVAPFIAGLLSSPEVSNDTLRSFLIIGGINFLSFIPQYYLLKKVYDRTIQLRYHIDPLPQEQDDNQQHQPTTIKSILLGEWNPLTGIIKGWSIFYQQKVFLVIIAYVLLWFTLLSPHDPVLTAYLSSEGGYSYIELSIFRGAGAIFGLMSTLSFSTVTKRLGIANASVVYIFEEGIMVLLAGIIFSMIGNNDSAKFMFLVLIVLSRCGLYGFEICEIHFVQRGVPDNIRGIVSGVESSLTGLASLLVFVFSLIINSTSNFYILVWLSIGFICSANLVLLLWRLKFNKSSLDYNHL
eukprot:gene2192-2695_t